MKKRRTGTSQTSASRSMQARAMNGPSNGTWELIATKAYELYEQRGRVDGHDVEDWLKAEAIVNDQTG